MDTQFQVMLECKLADVTLWWSSVHTGRSLSLLHLFSHLSFSSSLPDVTLTSLLGPEQRAGIKSRLRLSLRDEPAVAWPVFLYHERLRLHMEDKHQPAARCGCVEGSVVL